MREYLQRHSSFRTFKRTVEIALMLLSALTDAGILHMDARLDNYMHGGDNFWYLIDYGNAIPVEDAVRGDIAANMESFFESVSLFVKKSTSKDKRKMQLFLKEKMTEAFGN
jgi:tRNA A-37 threonylcarbamoyl transferase component Bud32